MLAALKDAGVNLVAFSGFPTKKGKAQLDLIADNMAPLKKAAKKYGWRLSKVKKGFIAQGDDEVGAAHRHIQKLADQKINITASVVWKDSTHAPRRLQNARRGVWRPFVHKIPRSFLPSEKLYFCASDFAGRGTTIQQTRMRAFT